LQYNCREIPLLCKEDLSTLSQNVFIIDDSFNTALDHIALSEIHAKMMSTQSVLYAATGKVYLFDQTNGKDVFN